MTVKSKIEMKHITIFILFFILSTNLYSSTNYSPLCMNNENVLFSFITKNNKIMSICISKDESYIVYRYGTKNKIELEYPIDKNDSWSKFKYSYYSRGGGPENEGLDVEYLKFSNNGYNYIIFIEYYAVTNREICGIQITNSKNELLTIINGDPKSAIGGLYDLHFNEKILKEDFL